MQRNGTRPHHWSSLIVLLVVLALLAGCSSAPKPASPANSASGSATPAQPAARKDLRIGVPTIPLDMTTLNDSSTFVFLMYRLVFDPLVSVEGGQIQPELATSWKLLDPTTWQVKLRQGVKFHNGEPFNANAVKFTIEYNLNPDIKAKFQPRVAAVSRVDVVDDYTVNFVTKSPNATMMSDLAFIFMLPPDHVKAKGLKGFIDAPVGTGQYQIASFTKDNNMKLKAFDDSWRGKPTFGNVTITQMTDDAARAAALQSGDVDLITNVLPEQTNLLKGAGMRVDWVPLGLPELVHFRGHPKSPIYQANGPWMNPKVRQALNYAIDKDAIVKNILGGYGKVLDGQPIGQESFGYHPNLKPYPYDPARAKQLLAEAGYPNGFEMTFIGSVGRYFKDKEVDEEVARQLAQVGVKANLQVLESGIWFQNHTQAKNGPLWMQGWSISPANDADAAYLWFDTGNARYIWSDPKLDALYKAQKTEMDPDKRKAAIWAEAEYFRESAPVIFLFQVPSIVAMKSNVQGVRLLTDTGLDLSKASIK